MVKNKITVFSKFFKNRPRSVNNFRVEHLGAYFLDFWSPYVAEASLGRAVIRGHFLSEAAVYPHLYVKAYTFYRKPREELHPHNTKARK